VLTGCGQQPALEPPRAVPTPTSALPTSAPSALATGAVATPLPDGALRDLVPSPDEVQPGLVPLLEVSGPRDAAAVASFSTDPGTARDELVANGFSDAYVVQYAARDDSRALTAVVVRFATPDGARADLEADLAASAGEVVADAPPVGEASEVRRFDLPDDGPDELVTVRFRSGATTWLLAWRAPAPPDVDVPVGLARLLAGRA